MACENCTITGGKEGRGTEREGVEGKGEEKPGLVNPLNISKYPREPQLQQTLLEITNKSVNLIWLSSDYFQRILIKINC